MVASINLKPSWRQQHFFHSLQTIGEEMAYYIYYCQKLHIHLYIYVNIFISKKIQNNKLQMNIKAVYPNKISHTLVSFKTQYLQLMESGSFPTLNTAKEGRKISSLPAHLLYF